MPVGPLGPQGPTVDPNWAWDVPGWVSQVNTGDVQQTGTAQPGGTTPGLITTPPAITLGVAVKNNNGLTAQVTLGTIGTGAASTTKDAFGNTTQAFTSATGGVYYVPAGGTITIGAGTLSAWTWVLQY